MTTVMENPCIHNSVDTGCKLCLIKPAEKMAEIIVGFPWEKMDREEKMINISSCRDFLWEVFNVS
jgi:hypothetical protein